MDKIQVQTPKGRCEKLQSVDPARRGRSKVSLIYLLQRPRVSPNSVRGALVKLRTAFPIHLKAPCSGMQLFRTSRGRVQPSEALYTTEQRWRLVSCPDRPAHTRKDGLGTLVDFLGTPARFGMVQSDCRISLITQLSRSNSRVTATQTPPPGHDTLRSSRITRLLLKCACA